MQTVSDYNNQTGKHLPQSVKEEGAVPLLNLSLQAEQMLELKEAGCQCLIQVALFLLTGQPANSLFAPGRIPPGSFEYDGLNR